MRTTDLDELRGVVEHVRAEHFPDLDSAFLNAIIDAEERNPEDDEQVLREIKQALDATQVGEAGS